jgi:hypothetical protein
MANLFDELLNSFGWLAQAPLLLFLIMVAFGVMAGQKPERAISWAMRCQFRLIGRFARALFGLFNERSYKSPGAGRNLERYGNQEGNDDSHEDGSRKPKGGRNRKRDGASVS